MCVVAEYGASEGGVAVTSEQRFFTGHDDDVQCLALDESRTIAASGQQGEAPRTKICVWDTASCGERDSVTLRHHDRAVVAVSFAPAAVGDEWLVSVGADDSHTVALWAWRRSELLVQAPGCRGIPPAVYFASFNSALGREFEFVTGGFEHVTFWQIGHYADDEGNIVHTLTSLTSLTRHDVKMPICRSSTIVTELR